MNTDYGIRFLDKTPFEDIHRAMTEAFVDYLLDMSYMTKDVLWSRAVKNGVDYGCSPGAFHEGKLVGLTLIGRGTWAGEPAAFDACTGIVKAHRGHGLAGKLFHAALPELKRRGTRRFLLEVLQENEPAIKAYERTGFRITRPLACFQRENTELPQVPGAWDIRPVGRELLGTFQADLDWTPSWENSFDAIHAIPDEVQWFGAFENSVCVGLAVHYPILRWIMMLVVKRAHRGRGIGKALLVHALRQVAPEGRPVRANNVDPSDVVLVSLLHRCGFREFTRQYEMVFELR